MNINRRNFLKAAMLAGGSSFIGASKKALAEVDFANQANRCGVLTDLSRCIGCRACESACNEVNKLPEPDVPFDSDKVFEKERRTTWKALTVVNRYPNPKDKDKPIFRKVQCFHCNDPACASAYLVGALKKTPEGSVIYDESVCLGCRYCMAACPFSIPAYEYSNPTTPKVVKCTMCYGRITKGQVPGCVEACPEEVHTFGKRNDLIRLAREKIIENPGKYVDHIYGEQEVGGTSWLYLSPVPFEQVGFLTDVENKAYLNFTKGFLSVVPVVLTLWPALLGGIYIFTSSRDQKEKEELQKPKKGGTKS